MRIRTLMTLVGFITSGLNHAAISQNDVTIRLSGWLDVSVTTGVTRSFFEVTATSKEISATLKRRLLGTREPEATDIEAQFKISDRDFVSRWRSSASTAFVNSSVHRGSGG